MLVNKKIFQFFVSNGEYFAEEIFEEALHQNTAGLVQIAQSPCAAPCQANLATKYTAAVSKEFLLEENTLSRE